MKALVPLLALLAVLTPASRQAAQLPEIQKITPILTVDEIEASLPFWVDRLGFEVAVQVPEGDKLGFVMLASGGYEIMLQTRSSVEQDDANLAKTLGESTGCLYVEVADIDRIEEKLKGVEIVVPRRKTFYGATEIFVREPGGHVIGFSQVEVPKDD